MNYEIVNLDEKIIVGVSAITSNSDPKMGEIIDELWQKLYQDGIHNAIKNKVNKHSIGLYSDYLDDKYRVTVGSEVSKLENNELTLKIIPAGKYAKFSMHGPLPQIVGEAWSEIWKMDLDRSYTGDFEEYLNGDAENGEVDIYIALRSNNASSHKPMGVLAV
ncbi:GyrI-like domain-containing protein [Clostridium neuense]|uniref:GyrI-like domain-containing protein n=1 Tax=Clostridium neuense TaxID=1728934 RepID=A0ABW8T939_9CLOT